MRKFLITCTLLVVSSVGHTKNYCGKLFSQIDTSIFKLNLTQLNASPKKIYIRLNEDIHPHPDDASRVFKYGTNYWFLPGDAFRYKMYLSSFDIIPKGTIFKIGEIDDVGGFEVYNSAIYLSSDSQKFKAANGRQAIASFDLEVFGSKKKSLEKISVKHIEDAFGHLITIYTED